MSLLRAQTLLARALPARSAVAKIHTGQCCSAVVNRDWRPGPYPRTEAERRAAAKKYNMLYEDYQPYPEDHDDAMGDYPMLPNIGLESKNPYTDYDFPALRRNYGEPVHQNFNWYLRDRWNVTQKHVISPKKQLLAFLSAVATITGLHFLSHYTGCYAELSPVPITKQLYQEGVVHYTFEPAE